jgi:hypothetical protein
MPLNAPTDQVKVSPSSCKPNGISTEKASHDGARHRAERGTRAGYRVGGEGTPTATDSKPSPPRFGLQHRQNGMFLRHIDIEAGTFKLIDRPALAVPMERQHAEELAACLAQFGVSMEPVDLLRASP